MSKIKMRCITCGRWFQSANAKEVTCPECTQKARREKMASKNAPPPVNRPAGPMGQSTNRPVAPPPKPKQAHSGTSHWLDSLQDVKVGQPDQPVRPKLPPSPAPRDPLGGPGGHRGPGNYREDRGPSGYREGGRGPGSYREGGRGPGNYREDRGPGGYREGGRGPAAYRVGGGPGLSGTVGQRPRQPVEGRGPQEKGQRPGGQKPKAKVKTTKPQQPPKPKREKTPPPQPFTPAPEQVAQVEARYMELANPTEFDGIRTQIAHELGIPKKAVKKIVKDLRDRQQIPSWWEVQTYKGTAEELEKIKAAYEPFLPVPPVGVHKQIADQLELKPGVIYQAIKAIRLEMGLPQYNDPVLHEEELALIRQEKERRAKERQAAQDQALSESGETAASSEEETPTATTPVEAAATDGTPGAESAASVGTEAASDTAES